MAFNKIVFTFLALSVFTFSRAVQPRIVSLAPSLTKHLILLNCESNLVGYTNYCPVQNNENVVANAMDVNFEKIYALKPNWVITTDLTSPEIISKLEKLKLQVKVFPLPRSFDDLCKEFLDVSKMVGKENEAEAINQKAKLKLNLIQQNIPKVKKNTMFLQIGSNPIFGAVGNTFMDDYIQQSGGINILSNIKNGAISRESVIHSNPDVIMIVTMGIAGKEEMKTWMGYNNMNAAKSKRVFIIDPDKSCSPTPLNFVEVVEEIVKLTYPIKN